MTIPKLHGNNHLERLPIELFQLIIDALPLKDTWRLRSLSRDWNTYLQSDAAKLGVVIRWSTHGSDNIAPLDNGRVRTMSEHFDRVQRFLTGQPYAWTVVKRIGRAAPYVLGGKWFVHALPNPDHGSSQAQQVLQDGRLQPSSICVWDLTTGRHRVLQTERMVITELVASKHYAAWLGPMAQSDGSFAMRLCVVKLADFTRVTQDITLPATRLRLAINGHIVILGWLEPDKQREVVKFEIIDCADGTRRTMTWVFNNAIRGWDFLVDADDQTITICTSSTWVAGPDTGQPRIEVRVTKLSFECKQISTRALAQEQHDLTALPWSLSSWRLANTGRPGAIATKSRNDSRCRKHIVLTIDERGPDSLLTSAFYLSHKPCAVWKDMIFSADAWGQLHINRNTTSRSYDALPLTKQSADSKPAFAPSYIGGVNESYVLMVSSDCFRIYTFDAPACQAWERTNAEVADSGDEEYTLEWIRVSTEFVKDRSRSIEPCCAVEVPRSTKRR